VTLPNRTLIVLIGALLGVGCASGPSFDPGVPCVAETFTLSDDFPGARRGRCVVKSASEVEIAIRAEDEKVINESPWYSFRISPTRPGTAVVTLRYYGATHRYQPKLSNDGIHWKRLAESDVEVSGHGRRAKIRVPLGDAAVWVSAQELITPSVYDRWSRKIAAQSEAKLSVLGYSRNGLPIPRLDVSADKPNVLIITGRQHPPEVSGAFAFFAFAETLLADTELAQQFRQNFRIIAIPIINPDGVIGGNWRHNLAGTDLNRDWGPFAQPETRAVFNLLSQLDESGAKIRMFADFHSTDRNLFYSQSAEYATRPPGFTPTWLSNAEKRLRNYPFTNEARAVSDQANSKNYMFKRYGIPAVTYEVGDETDRRATRAAAVIFAEELMKLLLRQYH